MAEGCDTCALDTNKGCYYGVLQKERNCSLWMVKDSCLLCKLQSSYFCFVHSKFIRNDSHQCGDFKSIANAKELRR